eukprot:11157133-Lingulodinium_polyedra.AAC.1
MGGPEASGAGQRSERKHAMAAWQMGPELVIGLTRAWGGAAIVVTISPDSLVSAQGWADAGAMCVPPGGDGFNE